jgi:hypothetical protein
MDSFGSKQPCSGFPETARGPGDYCDLPSKVLHPHDFTNLRVCCLAADPLFQVHGVAIAMDLDLCCMRSS